MPSQGPERLTLSCQRVLNIEQRPFMGNSNSCFVYHLYSVQVLLSFRIEKRTALDTNNFIESWSCDCLKLLVQGRITGYTAAHFELTVIVKYMGLCILYLSMCSWRLFVLRLIIRLDKLKALVKLWKSECSTTLFFQSYTISSWFSSKQSYCYLFFGLNVKLVPLFCCTMICVRHQLRYQDQLETCSGTEHDSVWLCWKQVEQALVGCTVVERCIKEGPPLLTCGQSRTLCPCWSGDECFPKCCAFRQWQSLSIATVLYLSAWTGCWWPSGCTQHILKRKQILLFFC